MKICSNCAKMKSLEAFYVSKTTGKAGSYCKLCHSNYNKTRHTDDPQKYDASKKAWRDANPEKARASVKACRDANPEKIKTSLRAWREANPEKIKYARIKYTYGLSPEEYDAMPKECAICGTTERLVVDHNHTTGEVRGVLCHKHNIGLGFFNDDPTLLLRAVDYLMGVLKAKVQTSINKKLGER